MLATRWNQRVLLTTGLVTLAIICLFLLRPVDLPSSLLGQKIAGLGQSSLGEFSAITNADDAAGTQKPAAQNDTANRADSAAYHLVGANEVVDMVDHEANYVPEDLANVRIVYSNSTSDGKYFSVDFNGASTYNVNIVSHPTEPGKYIVIAQSIVYRYDINSSEEVYCIASFLKGVLHCAEPPEALPLPLSINGQCEGKWGYTNLRRGPRDARAFWGPDAPYIIYGQQSTYTCLGLWIQDIRLLVDGLKHPKEGYFRGATELRRPEPWNQIEKNYFLFWDPEGLMYAHYDIWPKRAFSQINFDGTPHGAMFTGKSVDLALDTEDKDRKCMDKFMPKLPAEGDSEGIHQATNSLSITMCKRSDPKCQPTDKNTFIMSLFQHKTFYDSHGRYEPYVVLFKRRVPFELYAIGKKSLWIHGRDRLTEKTQSRLFTTDEIMKDVQMPENHTELFYTTSISWAGFNQTYHGYLDDVMFLAFGIEDTRSAAIDVLAEDAVQDLGKC